MRLLETIFISAAKNKIVVLRRGLWTRLFKQNRANYKNTYIESQTRGTSDTWNTWEKNQKDNSFEFVGGV